MEIKVKAWNEFVLGHYRKSSDAKSAKEIESVTYTKGEITTFAKPVKEFRGYTLKTTGKYNNKTGEFEYV